MRRKSTLGVRVDDGGSIDPFDGVARGRAATESAKEPRQDVSSGNNLDAVDFLEAKLRSHHTATEDYSNGRNNTSLRVSETAADSCFLESNDSLSREMAHRNNGEIQWTQLNGNKSSTWSLKPPSKHSEQSTAGRLQMNDDWNTVSGANIPNNSVDQSIGEKIRPVDRGAGRGRGRGGGQRRHTISLVCSAFPARRTDGVSQYLGEKHTKLEREHPEKERQSKLNEAMSRQMRHINAVTDHQQVASSQESNARPDSSKSGHGSASQPRHHWSTGTLHENGKLLLLKERMLFRKQQRGSRVPGCLL